MILYSNHCFDRRSSFVRRRSRPIARLTLRMLSMVSMLVLVCIVKSVDSLRRHADKVRAPPDHTFELERNWKKILNHENKELIERVSGTRFRLSTLRELGEIYTQYLSMLIDYHWELDNEGIEVNKGGEAKKNGNFPSDEKKSQELGNVLVSLFEFMEEFPKIPRDPETLLIVADIDETLLYHGTPLKDQPSITRMSDMATMYNDNTMMEVLMKASDSGNAKAQNILASVYATGVLHGDDGLVPLDAGRALILHYMSALSGNPEANVAMGYRYANGIGVQESCQKALQHYEYAANVAIDKIDKRGYPLFAEKAYLSHEDKATHAPNGDSNPEVLQYYRHMVNEGDSQAAINLGRIYMHGNKLVDQDPITALQFLKIAADRGSASAVGQLGYSLAQNLGGEYRNLYSNEEIAELLRFSSSRGDPHGVLGYGYIFMKGIGVQQNHTRAFELFTKVASKHPDAHFYIGEMLAGYGGVKVDQETHEGRRKNLLKEAQEQIDRGAHLALSGTNDLEVTPAIMYKLMQDSRAAMGRQVTIPPGFQLPEKDLQKVAMQATLEEQKTIFRFEPDYAAAIRAYSSAAQRGHVSALHRLGHMTKLGLGTSANCIKAVHAFRAIAEAGDWGHKLTMAHRKYSYGGLKDRQSALRLFARLAPLGYETAQYNAAHLLSRRVQPTWYSVSRDTTNEAKPSSRQSADLYGSVPRSVSLSWLSWSPWKFSQSGIPEPTDRLLSRESSVAEHSRILEHNRKAQKLKSSVSLAANRASDSSAEYGSDTGMSMLKTREFGLSRILEALYGFSVGGQAFTLLRSLSILMGYEDAVEVISSQRDSEARALNLYALSAGQGNSDAHMRLGDFHYYGLGWLEVDKKEAALFYQNAADLHHTHAIFNLGVMHEVGDGVKQDFHLAKRFYDQAAEFHIEARIPRVVALFVLQAHQYYNSHLRSARFGKVVERAIDFVVNLHSQLKTISRGRLRDANTLYNILFSETSDVVASASSTGTSDSNKGGRNVKGGVMSVQHILHLLGRVGEYPFMALLKGLEPHDGFEVGPRQFLNVMVGRTKRRSLKERSDERKQFWLQYRVRKTRRTAEWDRFVSKVEESLTESSGLIAARDYLLRCIAIGLLSFTECLCLIYSHCEGVIRFLLRDMLVESWPSRILLYIWRWIIVVTLAIPHFLLLSLFPNLGIEENWMIAELWIDLFSVCLLLLLVIFVSRYKELLMRAPIEN